MGRKKVTYTYRTEAEAKEASALEDFLFGGAALGKVLAGGDEAAPSIADLVKQAEAAKASEDEGEEEMYVEDRMGDAEYADEDEQQQPGSSDEDGDGPGAAGPGPGSMALQQQQQQKKGTKRGRTPVWVDPADAAVSVPVAAVARLRKLRQYKDQTDLSGQQYEEALRRQHNILNPRTTWAAGKGAAGKASTAAAAAGAAGRDYVIDDEREPDESAAEQLLLSGSQLLLPGGAAAGSLLAAGSIEMSRLRDANGSSPCDAVVQALQFHPNGQLMLTAGFDKRLKLFQVDGLRNPLVQSLFLQDCPIHTAAFAAGGSWVVAAGRRPFYYVADLNTGQLERVVTPPCVNLAPTGAPSSKPSVSQKASRSAAGSSKGGKHRGSSSTKGGHGPGSKGSAGMKSCESFVVSPDANKPLVAFLGDNGHIGLASLGSRTSVGSLKMNGSARAAAFSSDGTTLVTAGGDGVVYTWDLRSQRCLHQQRDEGVVSCTSLALSPDGSYLATGDSMGVVNLYSRPAGLLAPLGAVGLGSGVQPATPSPLKTMMNLTTAVDSLSFSHDSQVLLMGSRLKKESLRLVHMPSLSVFANWPTTKSPLHYVHCAAFSPHSGFLGIGNAKGRVLLYRVHHYPSV